MKDEELLKTAAALLPEWFRAHRRQLPWREHRTPYTALVAELMLQQTRVEAARERYVEFLRRFPTAEALARASEDEVLKAWEGLGYYSRAKNLQKAAKIIAEEGFPTTFEGVRALPGVGDYTAGAVCSIALGLKTPAVDGNVVRVLSRLLADGRQADDGLKKEYAERLVCVYPAEAGDFTEGLMELGALVCVPNGEPACPACPWREICRAHLAGRESDFPVRAEKKPRTVQELNVFVVKCGGAYALRRRGKGLLSGLWEFPNAPKEEGFPAWLSSARLIAQKQATHLFSHVEWRMTGYFLELSTPPEGELFLTAREIKERYALPSAFKPFTPWLE